MCNPECPSLEQCVEKRINHVCETDRAGYVFTYGENGDKAYKRERGRTYEVIDPAGFTMDGVMGELVEVDDDTYYKAYASCFYHYTPRVDGDAYFECTPIAKPAAFTPICPHCGQATLPDREFISQAEANNYAARRCDCPGGRDYKTECERKEKRDQNIRKIREAIDGFNYYCENKNQTLTDEIKGILFNCAVMTLDGEINGATVKFGRVNVKIGLNSKDAVTFAFTYSDCVKAEV